MKKKQPQKKNETSFKVGNKAAEKWGFIQASKKMIEFRKHVYENEHKSVQDAIIKFGMYPSLYFYIVSKYPVLERIKKDIESKIIATINDNVLEPDSKVSSGASIWRMKQLGETDKSEVDLKNDGGKFDNKPFTVIIEKE